MSDDAGQIVRRAATWLDEHGWIAVAMGAGGFWACWHFGARWSPPAVPWSVVFARAAIVVASVPIAQYCVRRLSGWLKHEDAFDLPDTTNEPRNRRRQKVLGIVENLAYPWILFALDPSASAPALGAWLVLKTVGNWKGWGETTLRGPKPGAPGTSVPEDKHEGRRRLYAFAVCNALQVSFGVAVAWIIGRIR